MSSPTEQVQPTAVVAAPAAAPAQPAEATEPSKEEPLSIDTTDESYRIGSFICAFPVAIYMMMCAYVGWLCVAIDKDWIGFPHPGLLPSTCLQYEMTEGYDSKKGCEYYKRHFEKLATIIGDYNHDKFWSDHEFQSRKADGVTTANLKALYLPGLERVAATVIVVHGANLNNRHHTVETVGSFLRHMGFNVMLPDLRNHGNSEIVGRLTWGREEVYDVLGAYDYIVDKFQRKESDIALYGFAMGGYICKMAFGMERNFRALVTDGAVHDLYTHLEFKTSELVGVLAPVMTPFSWLWASAFAGWYLGSVTPETQLKKDDVRTVGIIHSKDDVEIKFSSQHLKYVDFLKATSFETLLTVEDDIMKDASEDQVRKCTPTTSLHLTKAFNYQSAICNFFKEVFPVAGATASCSGLWIEQVTARAASALDMGDTRQKGAQQNFSSPPVSHQRTRKLNSRSMLRMESRRLEPVEHQ